MLHIESLENRQLLSTTLHPAAKPKPTIPSIVYTFRGSASETKPIHATGDLILDVTSESSKGILAGTFTNTTEDKSSDFTGKITTKGAVTIKTIDSVTGKTVSTFTGSYSSTTADIIGKYKRVGTKTLKPSSGTFTLSVRG